MLNSACRVPKFKVNYEYLHSLRAWERASPQSPTPVNGYLTFFAEGITAEKIWINQRFSMHPRAGGGILTTHGSSVRYPSATGKLIRMSSTGKNPDITTLRRFRSFADLTEEQLNVLARSLVIEHASLGQRVVTLGSEEAYGLLLLEGTFGLEAADGKKSIIKSGTESARSPIAMLLPHKYDVFALSAVEYLKVDSLLLQKVDDPASLVANDIERNQEFSDLDDIELREAVFSLMDDDLEHNRFILPSLPDVAVRINRALNDDDTDAERIASIVQTDPAITAKLLKAANSAFFGGKMPVDTCEKAVIRLGINMTQKLVLSFALRELFKSRSSLLQNGMQELWKHSTRVAAICYVLAGVTRKFNREHAMLAGLMHDIGEVGVLAYLENTPQLANDKTQIERVVKLLRGEVGSMILSKWKFQDDLIVIAEEAENWFRDSSREADYCDLVIVAQLHSYVGTPRIRLLPSIGELPSLRKLDLGEITPHESIKILDRASAQLAKAEALLQV